MVETIGAAGHWRASVRAAEIRGFPVLFDTAVTDGQFGAELHLAPIVVQRLIVQRPEDKLLLLVAAIHANP